MSGIGLYPPLQALGTGVAVAPILLVVLTGGLVGMSIRNMFDSILSDDEGATSVDANNGNDQGTAGEEGMADGGLMAEDSGDDFGDFGGLDDGGEDDGFGDDEFGDMDDTGAGTDELEHRLDELENEVGSLSSTVNTVRTENEQISESVEDVQENVRKLLDIYEMVTRGVNPFADDIEAGMGGGMDGGSFGLFDDGNGGDGDGGGEGLDEDIAAADAEGFFDEDLVDDGDDEFDVDDGPANADDVFGDESEPDDSFDDDFDDEFEDDFSEEAAADDGGGEGGKSFQELKDEYDSGDAEWAGGEAPEDVADAATEEEFEESPADGGDEADDDGDDLADDELFDEVIEDDGAETVDAAAAADTEHEGRPEPTEPTIDPELAAEPEPAPTVEPETDGASADTESRAADPAQASEPTTAGGTDSGTSGAGKPYLEELPGGFAGDLIVVEWLEFLTERSSYRATDDAIDYYERIDWISPTVAEELREYLRGFDNVSGDGGALTIDDHTQSLQYISQLDGDGSGGMALSKLVGGGGGNGLFG